MYMIVAIALGGALGAVCRYGVGLAVTGMFSGSVQPLATLGVNIIGCGLMGLVYGLSMAGTLALGEAQKGFLLIGFLGALTTFSSFSLDAFTLIGKGAMLEGYGYILLSVALSLGAFMVMARIARVAAGGS